MWSSALLAIYGCRYNSRGFNIEVARGQRSIGGGGPENSRIWSFHLDTLRVPKLAPHPALQPETEVLDPSKGKRRFPRVRRAGIRLSGTGFRGFPGRGRGLKS